MLKSLLASALFAGLIAGLFSAALQLVHVVPLIHEAELYESGEIAHFGGAPAAGGGHDHGSHDHEAHDHGAAGHGEGFDLRRAGLTTLFMILTFCGFALILVAGFALAERAGLTRVDARKGLLWGLAGFAAVQLAPAAGLAPELPGSGAAALEARQLWWLFAAVATAAGLALIAFGRGAPALAGGAALIVLPHLIGAPHPDGYAGVTPPELAALFAARTLAAGLVAWAALGALAGHFWSRERPI